MNAQVEMPQYQSHKTVWALKIAEIVRTGKYPNQGAILSFHETRYASLEVSGEYVSKHSPQVGGYYVRYPDGYESWSPAQAFEEGYTAVQGQDALRVTGISRIADNERAALLSLTRRPTDNELRGIHEILRAVG